LALINSDRPANLAAQSAKPVRAAVGKRKMRVDEKTPKNTTPRRTQPLFVRNSRERTSANSKQFAEFGRASW
jgi:hypothetical protein